MLSWVLSVVFRRKLRRKMTCPYFPRIRNAHNAEDTYRALGYN
jgi:hypothetical protein